jgi:DNA mismatch repair protein MutS
VARLAGVPATVIRGARTHLARLDHFSSRRDSDLFGAVAPPADPAPADSALRDRLKSLDPDAMSPRDAHDILYELKRLADDA